MYSVEQGDWNAEMQCYVRKGEKSCSPFESIPASFYWGITTMTTVGYGDTLPSTDWGKAICSISMVCGILVIALPVTMIGNQFVESFETISKEMAQMKVAEKMESENDINKKLYEKSKEMAQMKVAEKM